MSSTLFSTLERYAYAVGETLQRMNYDHEVLALPRSAGDVTYRSYSLTPGPDDLLLTKLLRDVTPDSVCYDVGAYTGRYALATARAGCPVYAFEPHPVTYTRLRKNVEANGMWGRVHAFELGVGADRDVRPFYWSSAAARSSFNRYNATYDGATVRATTSVLVTDLDAFVDDWDVPAPTHLKIDAEGTGLDVLRGAEDVLRTSRPTVYLEPHEVADGEIPRDQLRSFLTDLEYDVTEYGRPWPLTGSNGDGTEYAYPWVCTPTGAPTG